MKTYSHNPGYKLISVKIGTTDFVYGEENETAANKGLEVYRHKPGQLHHYHSSRYTPGKIPQIYNELYFNLQWILRTFDIPAGHKCDLTPEFYRDYIKTHGLAPQK